MRSATVIAVDPGKLTGLAMLRLYDDDVNVIRSYEAAEADVIPTLRQWHREWLEQYQQFDAAPLRFVIESFTITPETGKKNDVNYSLEQIGAVKQLCRDIDYPVDAIVFQRPSAAKTTFPNPKLKRLGLWHRGGAGHALDAIRHAVLYLVTAGWTDSRLVGSD